MLKNILMAGIGLSFLLSSADSVFAGEKSAPRSAPYVRAGGQTINPSVPTGSQVYYPTGTYYFTDTDLTVAARTIPMIWERTYRSNRVTRRLDEKGDPVSGQEYIFALPADGPLGYGWTTPWTVRIEADSFVDADGRYFFFEKDSAGNYLPDRSAGLTLKRVVGGGFELAKKGGETLYFDWSGKLTAVQDPLGHRAELAYDAEGRLSTISDVMGRTVFTCTYNEAGRISRITDLAGRAVEYQYDDAGHLVRVSRGEKVLATYSYNSRHCITAKSNALGETYRISYQHPDEGIVSKVIDPAGTAMMDRGEAPTGHVTTFRYLFQSRIFYVTDYSGATRKYVLNEAGQVISDSEMANGTEQPRVRVEYSADGTVRTTDAAGNVTVEQRDAWGNVLRRVDAEMNETTFTYNDKNRPRTMVGPDGSVTRFEYDASGTLPIRIIRAVGRPEEVATTFSYTPWGEPEKTTVDGATTAIEYNGAGLPVKVTDPLGNASNFEYDAVGNLIAAIDAAGNRSAFTYDVERNLLTAQNPLGQTTTYAYNAMGRLAQVTDPLGRVTRTGTDFKGRVTSITDALGHPKELVYDGAGNLVQMAEGEAVTQMTYDGKNRLETVTDPDGNLVRYAYGDDGCTTCGAVSETPTRITDPFGNVTENLFDKNGRIIGVQDPLGNLTSLGLDGAGRVTQRTDANGKATVYAYDGLGRVVSQTDAGGGVTSFTYNKRGNLTSLTDPEGNTTTFEYDLAGRKTKEIRPMGEKTEYAYYPHGLLKTVKDPKGQLTTYTYDAAGHLTEVLYADETMDLFAYDAAGNLTAWEGGGVQGTMGYDALNRKISETVDYGAFSKSFAYSYDARGNKATYISPEGIVSTYAYSLGDRLTRIEVDGKVFELTWDKTRLAQLKHPNGLVTDYAYNAASWLTDIDTDGPSGEVLRRAYGFDNVGNILTKEAEHGLYSYGYDDLYQLTSADNPELPGLADEAFTYDKVGNRLTSADTQGTWGYNGNNELLSSVTNTFEYDANGNTVKKTEAGSAEAVADPEITIYDYNARNRLERVTLPDGRVAEYAYDPFGRRVKKSVDGQVIFFAYADEGLVGEYDASGVMTKVYGWKPDGLWGTDPLYMVEGGAFYFYHNDHLGTPRKLTAASDGSIVWRGIYLSFGECIVVADSKVENNQRFPGQYFDEEINFNYNFYRFFDPRFSRYVQIDPIGFIGGKNHYLYSNNNPINMIDPFGLFPFEELKIVVKSTVDLAGAAAIQSGVEVLNITINFAEIGQSIYLNKYNRIPNNNDISIGVGSFFLIVMTEFNEYAAIPFELIIRIEEDSIYDIDDCDMRLSKQIEKWRFQNSAWSGEMKDVFHDFLSGGNRSSENLISNKRKKISDIDSQSKSFLIEQASKWIKSLRNLGIAIKVE